MALSIGTKTNVTGTGASVVICPSNPRRKALALFNDSGVTADVDMSGGTAVATSCTLSMVDQAYYELPTAGEDGVYTGAISGIWASGSIRVTEFE